jgi:protein AATF/BFR2
VLFAHSIYKSNRNERKSKLRKPAPVALGPQYAGSRISRDAIEESEDDDPFNREFDGEESDSASDGEESDEGESDEEMSDNTGDLDNVDDEDLSDRNGADSNIDRQELKKLMSQDQKAVATSLSQNAKSDIDKGKAVKLQRSAFDALLNVRIKLQKSLVSSNSLITIDSIEVEKDGDEAIKAAEAAAINLWNNLNTLRSSLQSANGAKKRKLSQIQVDSPLTTAWEETQALESEMRKKRNSNLDFWASKTRAATTVSTSKKFNNSAAQQTLSDVLSGQLSDMPRLVAKTKIPRSCAPLQAASAKSTNNNSEATSDLSIYDDADFYGTLLQSLISQRSADSTAMSALNVSFPVQPWQAAREAKTKKAVDTNASKGRKLRYTVHDKLQNYMAPEDRTTWGERQCDELFGSLLGRKMELEEVYESEEEQDTRTEGLRLF